MKQMHDIVNVELPVKPVSIEHHRIMYYPRVRLGLLRPIGDLPPGVERPEVFDKFGLPVKPLKPKKWGPLISDYGKCGDAVEKQWIQRRLQGTLNEPMLGKAKTHIEGIPGKLNPSVDSPGTQSCMTGGTTMSIRATSRIPKDLQRHDERQLGLYEDSFKLWRGEYKPPQYGLSTTDVTSFAGEAVAQKALMRA
jgi:hypothetical protein